MRYLRKLKDRHDPDSESGCTGPAEAVAELESFGLTPL